MADAGHLHNDIARSKAVGSLGFGCARLLMRVDRSTGARLIGCALDAGIRHIDLARSYGDGRTEAVVGEIARRRRNEMNIVTKAGLFPPGLLSRARRKLATFASVQLDAPSTHRFGALDIRRSLEKSLRSLKTDYVDALLLHGCSTDDITDELRVELATLKRSGKALRIGIAAEVDAANSIAAAYPDLAEVIQIDVASLPKLKVAPAALVVTHSIFSTRSSDMPGEIVRQALLANAGGVVLFSSGRREHIQSNATVASALTRESAHGSHPPA